jgi:hypothetical protein
LAIRLRQPVLLGLAPLDGWKTPSSDQQDVHAGDAITLVCRGPAGAKQLRMSARRADGSEAEFAFPLHADASEAPRLLWARQRVAHLLDSGRRSEAIACAIENNIVCEGASFVAWDDAECVPVATGEIHQPAMHPDGWARQPLELACFCSAIRNSLRNLNLHSGFDEQACLSLKELLPAPVRARSRMEELCDRYARFAYAGLPFGLTRDGATVWTCERLLRLRAELVEALEGLPQKERRVVIGILLAWSVRGGHGEVDRGLALLSSIAKEFRQGNVIATIRSLANEISGEDGNALRDLLAAMEGVTSRSNSSI